MKFSGKQFLLLITIIFLLSSSASATHYRAGEIIYETIGNYQVRCMVITYSKMSGPAAFADRDTITIGWGDNTFSDLGRVNGPPNPNTSHPHFGEVLANDIKVNKYVGVHTYPGAPPPPSRFYIISFYDQNRIDGINNIDGSVNIPFYVEDTVKFPTDLANIGFNSSPILAYPPIDYANLNDTFYHNPGAYDPDGDSLEFSLINCLQGPLPGTQIPLYTFPDLYCRARNQPNNVFEINRRNGQITWATPCEIGIFNIAILIREFRNGVNIGTMIRDMQIIVVNEPNNPPQISEIRDTCIRAGDALQLQIRATDDTPSQTVTLSAYGGPLLVASSPATFAASAGNSATGVFSWFTDCSHIQRQNYIVVFKAEDDYTRPGFPNRTPVPLVDVETWEVKVIAPPPQGLTATATNQSVTLSWQNPYVCASSPDFRGFSIWRKTGCDPFDPDYCETGLAGRGYTKISSNNVFTYTYVDNTTVVGQQYSYRIVAHFSKLSPNGVFEFDPNESVASDEVCVFMPIDIPVMLNVDVLQTDATNGSIFVRWTKPLAGGNNLDTLLYPPPYRFDLYRGGGFDFTNPVLVISTPDAPTFAALDDTTFTDVSINTQDGPWSYRVFFFSDDDTVGFTSVASSVYLDVRPSDQSLFLSWSENVPWMNDSFAIYKLNKVTSLFESIDTVYSRSYTDTGLINDSTYCYLVRSYGHYTLTSFPSPLINNSQEDCAVPIDTVAPCPPVLFVRNDCDQYIERPWENAVYTNYLQWTIPTDPCADDIAKYYLYYGSDSSNLAFLDSFSTREDTVFNHILNESLAGCYAVTALDRVGNESPYSNIFCVDNCPYYILPNTFTPNGDGKNDIFHPFKPYRFVPKIEMKIFNRWGEQVFETNDPEIGWDGRDQKTGRELTEGVYLYAGFYYEQRQSGLVRQPLSGEKKGGGFIHLIRAK